MRHGGVVTTAMVMVVVWTGEIGGVLGSFKDHKPRRPHRKPGGTPKPSKIPRESKIARTQRLLRQKRRKVHEANRAEKVRKMNPDGFEYAMATHTKDPWTGLPVARAQLLNQTAARQRIRARMDELQIKRKEQHAKVQRWRSVMHYATKPFAGQRGVHVIFVKNESQVETTLKQHGEAYDPWTNLTAKAQRRKQAGYKELSRHIRNLRKIDLALNRLRLKFLLLGNERHHREVHNNTVYYRFEGKVRKPVSFTKPKTRRRVLGMPAKIVDLGEHKPLPSNIQLEKVYPKGFVANQLFGCLHTRVPGTPKLRR
mmetsp:Transcript_32478/g.63479  ORF Transcript_32478/g.63479 Transcript_32478/m.63479 type:complete len:312 (+) Transcript_32478:172-1107(+)